MPPCLRFLLSWLHWVETLFQKNKLNSRAIVKRRGGLTEAIHDRPLLHIPANKQRTYLQLSTFRWCPKAKIQMGSLERAKTGRTSLGVHSAGKAPASWWGSMMSLASGGLWSVTQGQTRSYPLASLTPVFQWLGDNKQIPQENGRSRRGSCKEWHTINSQ